MIKRFALIAGTLYLLLGILGMMPATVTPPTAAAAAALDVDTFHGRLFGVFPVNILLSLFHLAMGAWGLVAGRETREAVSYARGLSVLTAILAVMGLFPVLNTFFGLMPLFGHDVWLHGLTALVAACFGWSATAARIRPRLSGWQGSR